jgi:hypothetical protein
VLRERGASALDDELVVAGAVPEEAELIAAQAVRGAALPDGAREALAEPGEERVAREVAVGVVRASVRASARKLATMLMFSAKVIAMRAITTTIVPDASARASVLTGCTWSYTSTPSATSPTVTGATSSERPSTTTSAASGRGCHAAMRAGARPAIRPRSVGVPETYEPAAAS